MECRLGEFLGGAEVIDAPTGVRKPYFITEDRQYDTIDEAIAALEPGETLYSFNPEYFEQVRTAGGV